MIQSLHIENIAVVKSLDVELSRGMTVLTGQTGAGKSMCFQIPALMLDGVTDVRNFGAIARTCECAGVDAIIIPTNNSAKVNADAIKTSAGALHTLPVCREKSLTSTIHYLKQGGFRVVAATETGDYNDRISTK